MLEDSEEVNSQQDSDVEPVQKNVELSDVTPQKLAYVSIKKTLGYCPLGSTQGKNPIGAPSTMKIDIKQIEFEETVSNKPKQFTDITSHKQRPTGFTGTAYADIETFEREHPLKKIFEQTSWNNIPLPLKDCLQSVVKAITAFEVKDWKRKKVINERFTEIHKCYDKLKERLKLVLAESRAQGVFIQEQIADILPSCVQSINDGMTQAKNELAESGQKLRESQMQTAFDIKKLIRGNLEQTEKVDQELKRLSKTIDDLLEELPFKMERTTKDFMKVWERVKMPKEQGSLDIKEYLKLMPQQFGAEIKILEGKLVEKIYDTRQDVQQALAGRIDQLTHQQLEVDDLIRKQTKNQIDSLQNSLEAQAAMIRQEIKNESAQIRRDEEDRRIRERPTSADLKAKEQRELDMFKEMATAGGKDDPVSNKLASIVKMILQIREEIIPQKIARAIEQFEGKLEVSGAKQKKLVKDSIAKVEKEQTTQVKRMEGFVIEKVENLKSKLGGGFAQIIKNKIDSDPALQTLNLQGSIPKLNLLNLNSRNTLEQIPQRQPSGQPCGKQTPAKESSKLSEEQSQVGDYMETYVLQTVKSRCDPLDDQGVQHGQLLKELQKQIEQLLARLLKIDGHFNQTIRAVCSTMGLVIRDVSGFTIQQEYIKKLDNEQNHRQKLKLGVNVDEKNEFLKVMHQNDSDNHSSIESQQSDEQFTGSVESIEQLNKSINSVNPKHWKVIEKKFNLKGIEQQSVQMDSRIRTNQSIDDSIYEKPKSQQRQFEVLSTARQQLIHTSGKQPGITLHENFLPGLKPLPGKGQAVERLTTTVQLTERYQKKTEFASLQFPDVTQAQRSVHEGPRQSQRYNPPQTSNTTSAYQSGVGCASLNIRRARLPNK